MAISARMVQQVQIMLRNGMTQDEIRREVEVSWADLDAIVRGEDPSDEGRLRKQSHRCSCGRLIYTPFCIACRAERHRESERRKPASAA
jgi:hypothetical protein